MTIANFFMPPSPIQRINVPFLIQKNIRLWLKRDDLLHAQVSGNKWRKLKHNLIAAERQQKNHLLTFGGAHSNHLYATAAAGRLFGFQTTGVVRGEPPTSLSPTIHFAQSCGMNIEFVSRAQYQKWTQKTDYQALINIFSDKYVIPEGGTNDWAILGCQEIVTELREQMFDLKKSYLCTSVGTGGTISGIISALGGTGKVVGFAALKGDFLTQEVSKILRSGGDEVSQNWAINNDFHFGGYAKFQPTLITFVNNFKKQYGVALDPVYTGKMMFGIFELLQNNYFLPDSDVIAIHTGGLQGVEGYNERFPDQKIQ